MDSIETSRLRECEKVIERGLKTFVDVGNALVEIRDSKLYRAEYGTFEDYCQERWGMERRRAYQLMDAALVVENVNLSTQILPKNELQARPLSRLEPEQQREAWQRAVETAPEGKITAAHVQSVVDEMLGPEEEFDEEEYNRQQILEANRQGANIAVPESKPHVANNSGNNEWYTPPEYIEAAIRVMGEIDLDPASSETANRTVKADVYYDAGDNGLLRSWGGRVWMNPPYASELIGKFCDKLTGHYIDGDISEAVILVNNATETGWFGKLISVADAVVFTMGRVKFLDPDGNPGAPLQGQAVVYMGPSADKFLSEFSGFGWGAKIWTQ